MLRFFHKVFQFVELNWKPKKEIVIYFEYENYEIVFFNWFDCEILEHLLHRAAKQYCVVKCIS